MSESYKRETIVMVYHECERHKLRVLLSQWLRYRNMTMTTGMCQIYLPIQLEL